VLEVGRRRRNQPAPPHAVFESLASPHRDRNRPWLVLLDDEVEPKVVAADPPHALTWSSLWTKRPDAIVRFDLPYDFGRQGTDLCWTLLVDEPEPDAAWIGHARKRLNQLINADLRFSFGQ